MAAEKEPAYAPKDDESVKPLTIAQNQKTVDEKFWKKLSRMATHIPFAEDAVASYLCVRDPNTPMHVKGILLAALAYFILPFDGIPDLLPFLGFTDDAAVIAIALGKIQMHLKPEHREQAREKLNQLQPDGTEEAKA